MPGTGWPFGYGELHPYYVRANALCEAGEFAYSERAAFPHGMRPILPGFHAGHFTDASLERFSCPTDFAARYGDRLAAAANISVLLHANVTEIRTSQKGRVASVLSVATLTGRRFAVRAEKFVLAAGGLEVPRLLLVSRDHHAHGIGNAFGQVGRCYMSHLAGTIGAVRIRDARQKPFHGYEISDDGIYCRRRFALSAMAQSKLGVGNFIARLHHPPVFDPSHRTGALSALYLARFLIPIERRGRLQTENHHAWQAHLRNIALDPSGVAKCAGHLLVNRVFAARKFPSLIVHARSGQYSLDFHAEQAPNPESRLFISRQRDSLGMQKLHVEWRSCAVDTHTVRTSLAALASDFSGCGCATLQYDLADIDTSLRREGAYGGHHIGTTRISVSPRAGVVDENCRVHGMQNLFVAGSAVFPTSSQANPTLTIVAMALRLADHIGAHTCQKEKEEAFT
jgi:choline dehydrogenase-like flavoprotein